MMFSLTMLPPIVFSVILQRPVLAAVRRGFRPNAGRRLHHLAAGTSSRKDLRLRDGFLVVAAFWTVLGTFGAAPLYFADACRLTITDAVFESMSGLTTTGATVLTGPRRTTAIDSLLPAATAVAWRHGYHRSGRCRAADAGRWWHAAVPRRNAGAGQRHQADAAYHRNRQGAVVRLPGIHDRLRMLSYRWPAWAGSTRCATLSRRSRSAAFQPTTRAWAISTALRRLVAIVFMFAAGINFSLHFFAWRYVSIKHYSQDPEFRAY